MESAWVIKTRSDQEGIAGHGVRVLDVVEWHEHQGMTPDQIVSEVPSLTLADVHAALAYYFDHNGRDPGRVRAECALVEEARRNNASLVKLSCARKRWGVRPDGCRFASIWMSTSQPHSRWTMLRNSLLPPLRPEFGHARCGLPLAACSRRSGSWPAHRRYGGCGSQLLQ